jgi:FkbM family methyltransferase
MFRYLNEACRRPRLARRVAARVLWGSGLCNLCSFKYNGFRLQFHPSAFSAALWINPKRPNEDEEFFAACLRPGNVVVDVGANIGTLSLAASRAVGPSGKVYSLEAHPRTYRFLHRNLALNHVKNVVARHVAVGNSAGTLRLSDKRSDDENTVLLDGGGLVVPVCTLDDLLRNAQHIDLLKIDVEGYEKYVLEGAAEVLKRTELVYFEAWAEHFARFGYRFADVWRLLRRAGFEVFRLSRPGRLASVAESYCPLRCENLVAIRNVREFWRRTGFTAADDSSPIVERAENSVD